MPSQKSEAFRYAPLKSIKSGAFGEASHTSSSEPISNAPNPLVDALAARLVYLSGHYVEAETLMDDLPDTVMVRALSNYYRSAGDEHVTNRLGVADVGDDTLAVLNTALTRGGIAIQVSAGATIDAPIEIVHMSDTQPDCAAHPRHVIELGEGASLTVIEHYVGAGARSWLNETLSVRISEGATLTHIRVVDEGALSMHSARLKARVDAGGCYDGLTVVVSGEETRFEADIRLMGEGATARTDAVLLAATGESAEMLSHIQHMVPGTDSEQTIRAIGSGRGRTTFQGKVTVAKDAQNSNADQSIKSLLLDRTAEANAKPELEIHADDVKCSHGATVGELDEKAYFYLLSRGVTPENAKRILVDAFAAAALGLLEDNPLKEPISARIGAFMARAHTEPDNTAGV